MHSDQDDFDRTPNMGEVVHFMLSTPRASDMKAGGHGDTGRMGTVRHILSAPKWDYARQIAALLTGEGLSGPSQTLPITYGWMMGYPPGWLATALISAMAKGSLRPASSSRRSATPSSPKSLKPSVEPS